MDQIHFLACSEEQSAIVLRLNRYIAIQRAGFRLLLNLRDLGVSPFCFFPFQEQDFWHKNPNRNVIFSPTSWRCWRFNLACRRSIFIIFNWLACSLFAQLRRATRANLLNLAQPQKTETRAHSKTQNHTMASQADYSRSLSERVLSK